MAFAVVYDACVLYPAPLRDLLIRLARSGAFRAHWSEQILDEVFRNLSAARPDLDPARLARTRALMTEAIPDGIVRGYESLIDGLTLPDVDDRHVLAAAIASGSQVIVTANVKDFPAGVLKQHGIERMSPDQFVLDLLDLSPAVVIGAVQEQAQALRNPPQSVATLLERLQLNGLSRTVAKLRELGC